MGQGLVDTSYTYSQYNDIVFGRLLKTATVPAQLTLIRNHRDKGFFLFIDNHIGTNISFEIIFNFLPHYYFSQTSFGPVYLAVHKTFCLY